jgi:hypothetical protein
MQPWHVDDAELPRPAKTSTRNPTIQHLQHPQKQHSHEHQQHQQNQNQQQQVQNQHQKQQYFTILVQLNPVDELCGGTEIWSNELNRGDLVRS